MTNHQSRVIYLRIHLSNGAHPILKLFISVGNRVYIFIAVTIEQKVFVGFAKKTILESSRNSHIVSLFIFGLYMTPWNCSLYDVTKIEVCF